LIFEKKSSKKAKSEKTQKTRKSGYFYKNRLLGFHRQNFGFRVKADVFSPQSLPRRKILFSRVPKQRYIVDYRGQSDENNLIVIKVKNPLFQTKIALSRNCRRFYETRIFEVKSHPLIILSFCYSL